MIKLILAINQQRIIGVGNALPWFIPEEMKHFKKETIGNTVVMGRNTWESIDEKYKPLVDRHNVVLSSSGDVTGAHEVFPNIPELLKKHSDFIVIGGKEIYEQFIELNLVDEILLSVVNHTVADTTDAVFLNIIPLKHLQLVDVIHHDKFIVYKYLRKVQ